MQKKHAQNTQCDACMRACMDGCMHVCMYAHTHTHTRVHTYILYIYIHINTDTAGRRHLPDIQVRLEAAEHEAKLRQPPHKLSVW